MNVIFDLDGTLIDSAADIHAASQKLTEEFGLPPVTLEQTRGFIGNGARVYVERLERASAGANEPARTDRLHARFLEHYARAHELTHPYPGVAEALAGLRAGGWRMAICTNKPMVPTRAVLAHLGWSEWFEAVIGGDSLPVTKPDPAPLRAAIAALDAGPAVYVGDSEVDAATARAASVPFAFFTGGYHKSPLAEIPHERAFDDWSELPGIAAALAR